MVDRALFLCVTAITAAVFLWMLCGREEVRGDDLTSPKKDEHELKLGSHLLKFGKTHFCGVIVEEDGFDLLIYDSRGNEYGITIGKDKSMISQTRIGEEDKRSIIIDKDGDGLPDLRVIHGNNGELIAKEKLKVVVDTQ